MQSFGTILTGIFIGMVLRDSVPGVIWLAKLLFQGRPPAAPQNDEPAVDPAIAAKIKAIEREWAAGKI